jgi:hypothetical protein
MQNNLITRLPQLLPLAIDWAQDMEAHCLAQGKPLAFWQKADAQNVGVRDPDRVRICLVDRVPQPSHSALVVAATEIRFLGPETIGLTLGYGIFIRRTHAGLRWLLRHELRHVAQCEQAGGLNGFLTDYLGQVARLGYDHAPLEVDARSCEQRSNGNHQKGKSS